MAKILIVDDSITQRVVLSHVLDGLSHSSVEALFGSDGLDVLLRENPDLVILDHDMPSSDGYDFSRSVRTDETYARFRDIPIVGNGDFPEDKQGFLDECYEKVYLTDPVQLNDVIIRQTTRYDRLHDSRDTYVRLVVESLVQYGVSPDIFPVMDISHREERVDIAIRHIGLPPVRPYQLTILTSMVSDAMRFH